MKDAVPAPMTACCLSIGTASRLVVNKCLGWLGAGLPQAEGATQSLRAACQLLLTLTSGSTSWPFFTRWLLRWPVNTPGTKSSGLVLVRFAGGADVVLFVVTVAARH